MVTSRRANTVDLLYWTTEPAKLKEHLRSTNTVMLNGNDMHELERIETALTQSNILPSLLVA